MRLFYQSPRPQRRRIDHQAHSRHQMPHFYDPNNRHFNYPIPYGHHYDSSCLGHYQAPPPYVRMQSPFPPPPIQRTHTPPPPNVIYIRPQTPGNQLSSKIHSPSKDLIYEIRESDVLCGRGAPSQYQTGNKFFRDIVERFQSSYIAARRIDKPEIATHIVDLVRERGGRFLKRVKVQGVGPSGHFCWQDIGEQRAYEKACQALREGQPEIRRKLAAKEIAAAALCNFHNPLHRREHQTLSANFVSPTYNSNETRDESLRNQSRDDAPCGREE